MTEDVIKELEKESGELSDFHKELLDHVMKLVKMSRSSMCKSYTDWDNQQMIYKGERLPDKDDVEQSRRDKPVKMVVPTTFAQVMTFSSFLFMLFTQNRTFYELVPTGMRTMGRSIVIVNGCWSVTLGRISGIACFFSTCWTRQGTGWGCWSAVGPKSCRGSMSRPSLR